MPTTYSVIVLPRAFADLEAILDHIAKESHQNAVTTIDRLWRAMQSLTVLPHRYEVHEHRRDPSKTVRSMTVAPFIGYYLVDNQNHVVRILHVRHGHRRQPRRFR